VDPKGIRVHAAKIAGDLDLSFASLSFPVLLWRCRVLGNMMLIAAHVPALNLTGSRVQSIRADGVHVAGRVLLRDGFCSKGEVRLLGAQGPI
jgi:hypothetical protein